ncbi:hypothetical protein ACIP5Y_18985 [Nocardia sp. NPDC088792]|uniref:hypothetical protein n=1 Tax=Nocardia sp. NPDC088792 TaxID=3364332 RepID=UPI00381FDBA3
MAHLAILEAPPTGDYLNQVQAKPGTFWWDWLANGPKDDLADQLIDGKESTFYGEHSMGASVGALTGRVAEHVTTDVVPNANHWVLEENPAYVLNSVRNFLES